MLKKVIRLSGVRLGLVAVIAVVGLAFSGVAQAAPPDPNTLVFTTLSNIQLNGVPGTIQVVEPGANVTISADWADSHPDYCPGCIDFLAVAFAGQHAAGCIENPGFTGWSGSGSVNLGSAPTTPGTYNIVGLFEFVYYCDQFWVDADSPSYTVVAQVVVLPTLADQCKNGGWQNFAGMFKNQGDCVSYVATKGKNEPTNSPT